MAARTGGHALEHMRRATYAGQPAVDGHPTYPGQRVVLQHVAAYIRKSLAQVGHTQMSQGHSVVKRSLGQSFALRYVPAHIKKSRAFGDVPKCSIGPSIVEGRILNGVKAGPALIRKSQAHAGRTQASFGP
ncbi:hypothetical protein PUNSTDRAFT_139728 [Punctularia strigosozonata HHB-11173 SS5]|uniref:Uncharacterized protein n=1 Tax=Punctularia strigosozonata (strain HHB-11173) TaxID=741275 RepID=R7S1Y9_PUNST|nr:uncharacterized protein PUNSTDRAFT_139728 [Punctularia strigosozonata HHB-11173 SS5]EIN03251.1 hypothetical protein PUNSTDRAFT_139728 [Punctularia strigosozonata HHB-11173 SS5]